MTEKDLMIQDLRRENAELQTRVPKWISVKDRLPRNYMSVLAYMPRHYPCQLIHECYIGSDGEWHSSAVYGVKSEDITHWMPIPKPPKGE